MKPKCIMLVATEASGDLLGANLIAALRARLGADVTFVGVGGPRMAAEGITSPFDPTSLALIGVFNAVAAYPRVLRRVRETADLARREAPDAAILIDAWGFNVRVAHALRRVDPHMKLIKYVAPQVWATRPGRARTLARAVDHLLTIHAFDAPYFEAHGLATTFVGNPALARDLAGADPARLRAQIGAAKEDPILLVLPGSRRGEIERLMPPFQEAIATLMVELPRLKVVIAAAPSVADEIKARVAARPSPVRVIEGETAHRDAMLAATVAMACSGTVTTELALAGCPMVVAYRLGPLTAAVAKRLIRTPYITLINVAAQAFVAPELVQSACTGPALATRVGRLLGDPKARTAQIAGQGAALAIMRGDVADPIAAAADAVVRILRREPHRK